ncbi:uncharacterized protein [Battus philenor]|uniref:uncharacterized protein n=1 Tax=Battus philenor TaxID=42288 RepID=UPI0035D02FAB
MDNTTPFQPWATDNNTKNVKTERELVDDAKLHRENVNHPKHRQTASYDKESVVVPISSPEPSTVSGTDISPGASKQSKMDTSKITSMQHIVENTLSQEGRQRVTQLLEAVETLSGPEKLLLYLRLPTGIPMHDPLKQPVNPLGSRAELQQTVTWIQTHLEVDPDVSLPKQDVYDEYIAHCMSSNMKPLSTADFGKVMKQVYPSVRPRRLGTRGNSRYCYAGLRKKIKLEVPQLPDLGESSKEPTATHRESERIVCDWAENKIGLKFGSIGELSRHLMSVGATQRAPIGPASSSPPPLSRGPPDDGSGRQLIKQLKRKLQTQGTPGRPKKNKSQEVTGESPPSTSYVSQHASVKHESEIISEASYGYQQPYLPVYDVRPPFPPYGAPPRAHPPHMTPTPHSISVHEYRADPYVFEPPYPSPDLTLPTDTTHNLPINLSSNASLDLSTERTELQRRRPPEPPPSRLPLPGKKLILETYQSETQASSPRSSQTDTRQTHHVTEEFPRSEYLPKKMRAAEIMGGKLAAARQALSTTETASSSTSVITDTSSLSEVGFLEDPKNLTSRSKSTAAALAREEQEAASPTQPVKALTPKCERPKLRKLYYRTKAPSPSKTDLPEQNTSPDSCCGLVDIKTGMICEEKHSEILNRERVISICNIDKHDLDDYLNEGNSQEHEEELLQYFNHRDTDHDASMQTNSNVNAAPFSETSQDPQDEHSQGKSEKISQLRELLAKNLKSQNGSQNVTTNQDIHLPVDSTQETLDKSNVNEGAFKPIAGTNVTDMLNGSAMPNPVEINSNNKHCSNSNNSASVALETGTPNTLVGQIDGTHLYNGNCHEPQSPTTRTQQYEFVPISDACHSPGNFHCKSPLGFGDRGHSPSKINKSVIMGGSLQTSPISHSTAASPFVSPRNTPVPRSRLCSRPTPKLNGRKRRNPLSLGMSDSCNKQFAVPNEQKFVTKTSVPGSNVKYCQPMSAPPSPNIITQYKNQMLQNTSFMSNGTSNVCLNFVPNSLFRENVNGDLAQPLSADPLSREVSQFFQEPVSYGLSLDTSYRSQSVPLKPGMNNIGVLSFNTTPVGSVPPTPVPNEFSDFGSLADTCDISRAGLNSETLDKIYDAIDSSNDVLNTGATPSLLSSNDTLSNGCDTMPEQQILTDDQLNSFIPTSSELLDRTSQFNAFGNDAASTDNVEEFLKRTNSIELDLSDLVPDKSKYYTSRSVPSTPLPYKRTVPNLQIDSRRSRELFSADNYSNGPNGISSKSVPSTPQLAEERSVFSYSNRDFLINGNSVEICGSTQIQNIVDNDQGLSSPLDMLREDILAPLTSSDLLADLDKMDGTPYVDL